jgi:hypothetical protein
MIPHDRIEEILAADDDQDAADELVDLLEPIADEGAELGHVVASYRDRSHGPLLRVLAFYLARRAHTAAGDERNWIYALVPALVDIGDASAITNACTTVQRQAMTEAPWHPSTAPPPDELGTLLIAALRSGPRGADDAMGALLPLAEDGLLSRLSQPARDALATALDATADDPDEDDVAVVRAAL